jgi:hypothetical protein
VSLVSRDRQYRDDGEDGGLIEGDENDGNDARFCIEDGENGDKELNVSTFSLSLYWGFSSQRRPFKELYQETHWMLEQREILKG